MCTRNDVMSRWPSLPGLNGLGATDTIDTLSLPTAKVIAGDDGPLQVAPVVSHSVTDAVWPPGVSGLPTVKVYGAAATKPTCTPSTKNASPPPGADASISTDALASAPSSGAVIAGAVLA